MEVCLLFGDLGEPLGDLGESRGALFGDFGKCALELRARRRHEAGHGPLQVGPQILFHLLQQRVEHGLVGNCIGYTKNWIQAKGKGAGHARVRETKHCKGYQREQEGNDRCKRE
jgi:hypothetical protein